MGRKKHRRHDMKTMVGSRHNEPGSPPGTLVAKPDTGAPVIHVMGYGPEAMHEATLDNAGELTSWRGRFPVLWVDVLGTGDAGVFRELGEHFGLHPLALEDAVNAGQRPKVEDYDDHAFLVCREAVWSDGLGFDQLSIFLGGDVVVTVRERSGNGVDIIRQRIRKARGRIRRGGADYLAYALTDAVLDSYFPLIDRYGDRLEALEAEIVSNGSDGSAADIHAIRHELHALRRVLTPTREALTQLTRGEYDYFHDDTQVFFRDCQDHVNQLLDALDAFYDFSGGLMDLHFWNVNQRMNETMRLLTLISTIFIPLGFIASVYGMNFDPDASPFNMPELRWLYGYPFALALMAVTAAGLGWLFYRRGWLNRGGGRRGSGLGGADKPTG